MEVNVELSVEQQIQYARGGLKFNGKDWNGYFYYMGDRSGDISLLPSSSFGGKCTGDHGVLQGIAFTEEFAQALKRENIVKDEAITKITQEICWMAREKGNGYVDEYIVDRFRAGPLNDEQEDANIRDGLNFLGKDYNGYEYSYGRRDSRKPGHTVWGSGKEGEKGIQQIDDFEPEFERAVRRDCVVTDQGIQRALDRIRKLATDFVVTERVIENFKKN